MQRQLCSILAAEQILASLNRPSLKVTLMGQFLVELDGVTAHRLHLLQIQVRVNGRTNFFHIRGLAHVSVTPFALHTGAHCPQPRKRVTAFPPITPFDDQNSFISIRGHTRWLVFVIHKGKFCHEFHELPLNSTGSFV